LRRPIGLVQRLELDDVAVLAIAAAHFARAGGTHGKFVGDCPVGDRTTLLFSRAARVKSNLAF
jgi:hypothetical protein